jgi:acyl carrier protein
MPTLKDRVADCFCAIFPEHSREELLTASRESIPEWDSLAGVTLLTLLQQEFNLDIDLGELEHFNSVPAVVEYVTANAAVPGEPHGG